MTQINMKLSKELVEILSKKHNIDAYTQYKPAYGGESIGLDLYYSGNTTLTLEGIYDKTNGQNDKVLIPTGVYVALPLGYRAAIRDRGSISKTNLVRRAGEIDPGYTGEIFVNLAVLDGKKCVINPGEKLPVQLIITKVETDFKIITEEEYAEITKGSLRGTGKVGSSN